MDVLKCMYLIMYCLKWFRRLDFNHMAIVQMLILFNIVSDKKSPGEGIRFLATTKSNS